MQEKTPYERIIGGTNEEKEIAHRELQEMFEGKPESFSEYELEKTPEDKELIDTVMTNVDDMVRHYGGDPKALPIEKIHLLKPDSVGIMTDGELFGGIHKPLSLNIGVEKGESRFALAAAIAHELFHAKSYKAARVGESGEDVRLYRTGISMVDRKDLIAKGGEGKEYFGKMEEAIIAECVKRLLGKISKNPLFREEAEAIEKIKAWVMAYYRRANVPEEKVVEFNEEIKFISNPQERVEQVRAFSDEEHSREVYATGMFDRLFKENKVEGLERYTERTMLSKLMDELVQKSNGRFKNQEAIFAEFAKAHFTGNYLNIARIIEGELGKGSFRKIANEFAVEGRKNEEEGSEPQGN